jgi:hypothetical protein
VESQLREEPFQVGGIDFNEITAREVVQTSLDMAPERL